MRSPRRRASTVHIENAPIACALAQMWLGKRGDEAPRDFVYVTVSDGVGAGVVVNGEVVRGHNNTAGEFGHVPIDPTGPTCLCGAHGCLEAYTSNLATLSRYLGHEFSPTRDARLLHDSGLTIADVIARAAERRGPRHLRARGNGAPPRRRAGRDHQHAQPGADLRRRRDHRGLGPARAGHATRHPTSER